MSSLIKSGNKIEEVDLLDILPPEEGSIDQFYGRIGSGKTYMATRDVLKALNRGDIVYCNWIINWQGYDEREHWWPLLLGLFGLKRIYYKFPKENLHYLPITEDFQEKLGKLTDCQVYLDEGHLAFDSYKMAKMDMQSRANVLHTRHFDRKIVIISQRPTAIHVTLRANVNRFFKCECLFKFGRLLIFRKTEYQDLDSNDRPDETEGMEISSDWYLGLSKIFNVYDTKYMRGNIPTSQPNYSELWRLSWKDKFRNLFNFKEKKLLTDYQQGLLQRKEYFDSLKKDI